MISLSDITNKIYVNLDESIPIIVTFLDLVKAFDTAANHKILLEKLRTYGIRGKAHQLLEHYLTNRKQQVKIGQFASNLEEIGTFIVHLIYNRPAR